jgi:oligopeptide transport system substrate-binding protein
MNIMEGLVRHSEDLKISPALAEKWELSPDGKRILFTLRKGVQWTDGQALHAQQFVDSWARLLDRKNKSPYLSFLFDLEGAEDYSNGKTKTFGARAIDAQTLEVRLTRASPIFMHLLTFWVTFPVRKELIARHGKKWADPGNLVTLGPYRLKSWARDKNLELTLNPKYFDWPSERKGIPERIQILEQTDDKKARALFESGELDFFLEATTADLLRWKKPSSGISAKPFAYLATYYMGFNFKREAMKNTHFRKALALAVDRSKIPAVLQGGQTPALGWIPPGMPGYALGGQLQHSLYEARGTLSRAGFTEGVDAPKLVAVIEAFDQAQSLGEYLVSLYREKLGLELAFSVETPENYLSAIRNNKVDLFIGHWGADYPDPANFFEVFTSQSGSNRTGWKNDDYDQAVRMGRGTAEMKARLQHYLNAEKILLEQETVILPIFYRQNLVLLRDRVKTFSLTPLNYLFFKDLRLK